MRGEIIKVGDVETMNKVVDGIVKAGLLNVDVLIGSHYTFTGDYPCVKVTKSSDTTYTSDVQVCTNRVAVVCGRSVDSKLRCCIYHVQLWDTLWLWLLTGTSSYMSAVSSTHPEMRRAVARQMEAHIRHLLAFHSRLSDFTA